MSMLLQGAGGVGAVVPPSVQGSSTATAYDFNVGAGYTTYRCPFTTNAGRTIHSIDVRMHGGTGTGTMTIRTAPGGTVVATSVSTNVGGSAGDKNFAFTTPFSLPAGDYYMDFVWTGATSPEVGNATKVVTGVITAIGNSLGGYSTPAATLFNGYANWAVVKLNGTV